MIASVLGTLRIKFLKNYNWQFQLLDIHVSSTPALLNNKPLIINTIYFIL